MSADDLRRPPNTTRVPGLARACIHHVSPCITRSLALAPLQASPRSLLFKPQPLAEVVKARDGGVDVLEFRESHVGIARRQSSEPSFGTGPKDGSGIASD